jgi:hypothetical protein
LSYDGRPPRGDEGDYQHERDGEHHGSADEGGVDALDQSGGRGGIGHADRDEDTKTERTT